MMSLRAADTRIRACRSYLAVIALGALCAVQVQAAIAPEGDTTHVKAVRPGDAYRGVIVVRNTGAKPVDVKLYQTDYAFTADGKSDYGAPGKLPRSNAAWLRLSQAQTTIPAGERGQFEYEVSVPDDARLIGTYWSSLMVEPVGGAESSPQDAPKLRQVIRHAIQVITEIGETGRGELSFGNAHLLDEAGKRWFSVDMQNTGERWLRTNVWLELHDAQGRLAGRFSGRRLRTFPATSVRNRIDLSTVAPGKYLALLVADAGRNDLFGTRIELEIP
jgi:hypothetical protein